MKRRETWWKRNQGCMVNDAKLTPNRTLSHYTISGNHQHQYRPDSSSHCWPTSYIAPILVPGCMCALFFVMLLPRIMRGWTGIEPRAPLLTGSSNDSPNTAQSGFSLILRPSQPPITVLCYFTNFGTLINAVNTAHTILQDLRCLDIYSKARNSLAASFTHTSAHK